MHLTIKERMGAKRFVQRLLQMQPELFVVVTAEYAQNDVIHCYRDFSFETVLPKPFTIEEFIQC